jgi:ElaB/YqjD/DUF883 family membrane-anchored ribosome-binding protein
MNRHADAVTKDQLIEEFNVVVSDTERLLRSVATGGGEKAGALHASIEQNLAKAKDRLLSFRHAGAEKARAAVHTTDGYVHDHPWQAIGVAAGVNILLGMAIVLLLNRR